MKTVEAFKAVDARFRSGNNCAVERATVTAKEWAAFREAVYPVHTEAGVLSAYELILEALGAFSLPEAMAGIDLLLLYRDFYQAVSQHFDDTHGVEADTMRDGDHWWKGTNADHASRKIVSRIVTMTASGADCCPLAPLALYDAGEDVPLRGVFWSSPTTPPDGEAEQPALPYVPAQPAGPEDMAIYDRIAQRHFDATAPGAPEADERAVVSLTAELASCQRALQRRTDERNKFAAELDACSHYLKPGERVADRIARELRDSGSLLEMLAGERAALEAARAQSSAAPSDQECAYWFVHDATLGDGPLQRGTPSSDDVAYSYGMGKSIVRLYAAPARQLSELRPASRATGGE